MNLNLKTGRGYGASASGIAHFYPTCFFSISVTAGTAANLVLCSEGYEISESDVK